MKNNAKMGRFGEILKNGLKAFFTKNIGLKIISLIFAMLLWGYVLISENPSRVKTISNVTVNMEGAADLVTRRLTIRGDMESLLDDVSVRVETELTSYADLSAEDVTATVNLSRINSRGTHFLTISATSSTGQVVSVSPSRIEVVVDSLVTRSVPVEVKKTGELPAGYWAGEIGLDRTRVELEGAESDLKGIAKAVGSIDLTGRTEGVNHSMVLTLLDEAGNEVSTPDLFGAMPTVIARLDIFASKTVPIDVEGAVIGQDALPEGFEIVSYGVSQGASAQIVGDADVLAGIDALSTEQVDVTGMTEPLKKEVSLLLPDGVRVVGDSRVELTVAIREKRDTVRFDDVPVEIVGLGRRLTAALSEETADIAITGKELIIAGVTRGDIRVYADITGLTEGVHDVKLAVELNGETFPPDMQYRIFTAETIQVTIEP